jgi:hypothetical protein
MSGSTGFHCAVWSCGLYQALLVPHGNQICNRITSLMFEAKETERVLIKLSVTMNGV